MCEQTEVTYLDGDVVWVKLGPCWWPGEVWGFDRLPPGLLKSFRKPPIAVVKFFQEEAFEYVKNLNLIYKYNCTRKHEFIKKGLDLFRSKHTHMDKFPEDVCTAERRTDGNPDIITDDEFLPKKKESYANIFGTPSDTSSPLKKTHGKRGRPPSSKWGKKFNTGASSSFSDTTKVNRQRFIKTSDYKARILVQPNNSNISDRSNQFETSNDSLNLSIESGVDEETPNKLPIQQKEYSSPTQSNNVIHTCPTCNFTSTRLNVIILHNKSHSASSATYYTPVKKIKARSPLLKEKSKSENLASLRVDENNDFPSRRKRGAKVERSPVRSKVSHDDSTSSGRTTANSKSKLKDKTTCPPKKKLKIKEKELKKPKTDVEIKNSLLADWSEDSDDESMDILASLKLTENQNTSTTSVVKNEENDASNISNEKSPTKADRDSIDKSESVPIKSLKSDEAPKAEKREQTSCFDFEEDEYLQIEKLGRKIPRLSIKSDEPKKPLDSTTSDSGNDAAHKNNPVDAIPLENDSLDLDSEVNNLLKETVVPDLPSLPVDSNFQKSKVVKVPDKEKDGDSQYVFKTKTFFRSRHSRSQDAIEKYVADNTSTDKPPTYMEETIDPEKSNDVNLESSAKNQYDVNVADVTIPELTDPIKVTKYTPKLEFKKMKALNKHKLISQDNISKSPQVDEIENLDNICDNLSPKTSTMDESKSICKENDDKLPKSESRVIESNSCDTSVTKSTVEIIPTESDTQIAETLNNPPCSDANSVSEKSTEVPNVESEMKFDENIISTVDKSIEIDPPKSTDLQLDSPSKPVSVVSSDLSTEAPKLFKILEESKKPQNKSSLKILSSKIIKPQGKEKILNFDVSSTNPRTTETQNIIIRRKANLSSNSFGGNEFNDSTQELILSSKPKWSDDGIQTFTIEGTGGANSDTVDPKLKMILKTSPKHHITPSTDIISHSNEKQLNISGTSGKISESTDSFIIKDPNHSLSSIEVVKSDTITSDEKVSEKLSPVKKLVDSSSMKMIVDTPIKKVIDSTTKRPKIIVKSVIEKSASPNILSRSVKAKTMKHLLLINKSKNEKHMLISQPDNNTQNFQSVDDFIKQNISPQTQTQNIILNTGKLSGGKKAQKIVLNALPKGQISKSEIGKLDTFPSQGTNLKHKTSGMKVTPSKIDLESPAGNAYMILTNSQGVQSKIVLTPEHQKLLFPKTKITGATTIVTPTINSHKASVVSSSTVKLKESITNLANNEPQHHTQSLNIVPKQKGTILNSKGQIVMSGNSTKRTILTTMPGQAILTSKGQIIAPQSSIITSSAKLTTNLNKTSLITSNSQTIHSPKVVQSQKTTSRGEIHSSPKLDKTSATLTKAAKSLTGQTTTYIQGQIKDPALLLAQKPGSNVMRLTAAQFEHLTKTGQLIQKSPAQKNSNSQNKVPSGKMQNQQYILQRFVGGKPDVFDSNLDGKRSDINFASGKHKMEVAKLSTDVPPLAPIHSEKISGVHSKQKFIISANEAEKLFDLTDNKATDSDDSNMFENLDKLIPATIIPTRKRDTNEVAQKDKKPQIQSKVDVTKEVASVNPKENENLSAVVENSQISSESSLGDPQNLLAISGENFGGPLNSFFLCVEENGALKPINNQPLVLENNQLVPMVITPPSETESTLLASTSELPNILKESSLMESSQVQLPVEQAQANILLNTGDQQLLIDHQTFLSLLAGDGQLVTADGQNLVLQGGTQQLLSALAGSPEFANLLTSGQQILLNATGDPQQDGSSSEQQIIITAGGEGFNFSTDVQPNVNQDILAAALASTDVFQQETLVPETMNISTGADGIIMEIDSLSPKIQNVTNSTVHSNVFETSSTLNQPIMSPLEQPTKKRGDDNSTSTGLLAMTSDPKIIPKNLEDSLAVIGVATTNVPTSLELPITVTNPRIAAKTTSPLSLSCSTVYQSGLLNSSIVSPGINIFESEPPSNTIALTEVATVKYHDSPMEEKIQVVEDIPQQEKNEKELEKSFDDKVSLSTNDKDDDSSNKPDVDKEHDVEIDSDQSKQISGASSMPCLDESTSESYSEEVNNQASDKIEAKTYSPISMPILTDDTSEQIPVVSVDVSQEESQEAMECSKDLEENATEPISTEDKPVVELVQEEPPKEDLSNGNNMSVEKDTDVTNTDIIKNEDLQEVNSETCIQAINACDKETSDTNNVADDEPMSPHIDPEAEEICAETPPDFTQNNSPMRYDDQDVEDESIIPNIAEENSIPDHTQEDLSVSLSSDIAVPDSTLSSLETASEPPTSEVVFSESSDDSNEIPIQPTISVSHHMVQNFSSLLNNAAADDKSDDCSDKETKLCENFDNHEEAAAIECEIEGER